MSENEPNEDTCTTCGGEGSIEWEFPVPCNAEEPDIRMVSCPECSAEDDREYEPDEELENFDYDYHTYWTESEPDEF